MLSDVFDVFDEFGMLGMLDMLSYKSLQTLNEFKKKPKNLFRNGKRMTVTLKKRV